MSKPRFDNLGNEVLFIDRLENPHHVADCCDDLHALGLSIWLQAQLDDPPEDEELENIVAGQDNAGLPGFLPSKPPPNPIAEMYVGLVDRLFSEQRIDARALEHLISNSLANALYLESTDEKYEEMVNLFATLTSKIIHCMRRRT